MPRIELTNVNSSLQSHSVQPWHSALLSDAVSAKLQASWNDQGWGNQKGAIHARVSTADGASLHNWRRVGPYPAPHQNTEIEVKLPEEFFSGQGLCPDVCLRCTEGGGEIKIPQDPAKYIASARYGVLGDKTVDVTDIVKSELAAGKPVKASPWQTAIQLFGDPCSGHAKGLVVTLTEEATARLTEEERAGLCLSCDEAGGGAISIPGNDPALVASAKYGLPAALAGEIVTDVTEVVKRELAEGRPVKATPWQNAIALFGDPCHGVQKELEVTLTEDAPFSPMMATPDDARLELGFEVGGGGGHSLRIQGAYLNLNSPVKVLTATLEPPEVVITTMAGEEFARLAVGEEDTEETCAERIKEEVRRILGDDKDFQVVMAETNTVIKS